MQTAPTTLVAIIDGGLGWDVTVPPAPDKYDATTIIRMVRQVNRRGRIRFFQIDRERTYLHTASRNDIKGEDDLTTFVAEVLTGRTRGSLTISFEERFEARALSRDLDTLVVKPSALEQLDEERQRRVTLAARYDRFDFPEPMRFPYKVGSGEYRGHKWLPMIAPTGQSISELVQWMRRHTGYRYFAGVWVPGQQPQMAKVSWRYWRLAADDWHRLMDRCRGDDSLLLIVHFFGPLDAEAFDRRYGPAQFLNVPPPRYRVGM